MFLDEKLLEIGRSVDLNEDNFEQYKSNVIDAIKQMLVACMDNIESNITEKSSFQAMSACFRRVNNTWKSCVDKLNSEGRDFVKETGFEDFVKSKSDLNRYLD